MVVDSEPTKQNAVCYETLPGTSNYELWHLESQPSPSMNAEPYHVTTTRSYELTD